MVDQIPQDERFPMISRFSTSSSLRRSSAVDRSMQVVPMPRWSTAVGCARFALATLFLVFTSAATAIWGGSPAFGIALFTSSASLVIFAYYFVALSHKPTLYSRWVILGLEVFGVVFWLVSVVLMANWTSSHNRFWFGYGDSYGFWSDPLNSSDIDLRTRGIVKRSTNKYHAGVALAGTAAGLGGVEFVLYLVTLIVFGLSLHRQRIEEESPVTATPTAAPPAAAQAETGQTSETGGISETKPEAGSVTV